MSRLEMYVDGSCYPNPGVIGYSLYVPKLNLKKNKHLEFGTNNTAEMLAIELAIDEATCLGVESSIFSDSTYAVNVLTGKWKAKVNLDLVGRIKKKLLDSKCTLHWVKGHADCEGNLIADELATEAMKDIFFIKNGFVLEDGYF